MFKNALRLSTLRFALLKTTPPSSLKQRTPLVIDLLLFTSHIKALFFNKNQMAYYELNDYSSTAPLLYPTVENYYPEPLYTPPKSSVIIEPQTAPVEEEQANPELETEADADPTITEANTDFVVKSGWLMCADQSIEDQFGHNLYKVNTTGWLRLEMSYINQRTGREVLHLRRRFGFFPSFDISKNGMPLGTIRPKIKWGGRRYILEVLGESPITIEAGFFLKNITMTRDGVVIATADRNWSTYNLHVATGEDYVVAMGIISAIDKFRHMKH